MITDLDRLKIELELKKSIKPEIKRTIKVWMNRAYELGLKEAGRIIGEGITKEINIVNNQFANQKDGGEVEG